MRMSTIHDPPSDWRSALGVIGLLVWLFMFSVVEYAHDMLMTKREGDPFWPIVYEVSAGYVLGFVAALAVWMLKQLARGPVPESFPIPWSSARLSA
jgi:hypothetical protein